MGRSLSVSLHPSLFLFTVSGLLSLWGTLGDVPSVTCASVDFINISANVYNSFKYSIQGYGKGDADNGFLSALVWSMSAFLIEMFEIKTVTGIVVKKTPLCHLRALMPYW